MNRELPNSQLLEQSLLGSIMIYPDVLNQCKGLDLRAQEFYVPGHQKIYEAMLEVQNEGHPVDMNNLVSRLGDKNQIEETGGIEYLSSLSYSATSSANARSYIQNIKNKAQLRALISACELISAKSFEEGEEIDQILDQAERSIMEVTRHRRGSDFESYENVARRVMNELENMKSNNGVNGLMTGFRDLDLMTSGLHPGDLIILAARPAMGKSAFALNLASNVAAKNRDSGAVALFSLEMPSESLIKRMLSCEAHIEAEKLRNGRLSREEFDQLYQSASFMSTLKLFVDDTSSIQVSQIFSKCRKLKSEHDKLALIIIDYLQLISGTRNDSRQQEVSEISRNLKILAKEMECPVVALSQLSRKVEERTNHEPMLSDLRESGSIEQDADIVMFLYRESYYESNDEYYGAKKNGKDLYDVVDLSIAKHRNGSTGKIKLVFEKEYSTFSSADLRTGLDAI